MQILFQRCAYRLLAVALTGLFLLAIFNVQSQAESRISDLNSKISNTIKIKEEIGHDLKECMKYFANHI